ncbi:MAG: hypothetical protein MJ002_07595 [Paludibacteraceae bacterium]|nr:hypothetical protein [Paludibacteraceae bacterium]
MKTKSLLFALVAGLMLISGCSKNNDDDSAFNWKSEFQRAMKFSQTPTYANVVKELLGRGYLLIPDKGENYYAKVDKYGDTYYYAFTLTDGYINNIEFGVISLMNPQSKALDNKAYADMVQYIGAEYKVNDQLKYIFGHVSYDDISGTKSESVFQNYIQNIGTVANCNSTAIWDGTDGINHIIIDRDPVTFHNMSVSIGKKK